MNAFNSLDRNALLSEVKARAPGLFPYAWACHHQPNILFGDCLRLESSCEVQQGDVCGTVLFAIALHKVVLKLQELGLNFQFWYLDDGILCGSVEAVGTAILLLKQELPPLQLDLNLQKCKVFAPNAHSVQHPGLEGIPRVDFHPVQSFLECRSEATTTFATISRMLTTHFTTCRRN